MAQLAPVWPNEFPAMWLKGLQQHLAGARQFADISSGERNRQSRGGPGIEVLGVRRKPPAHGFERDCSTAAERVSDFEVVAISRYGRVKNGTHHTVRPPRPPAIRRDDRSVLLAVHLLASGRMADSPPVDSRQHGVVGRRGHVVVLMLVAVDLLSSQHLRWSARARAAPACAGLSSARSSSPSESGARGADAASELLQMHLFESSIARHSFGLMRFVTPICVATSPGEAQERTLPAAGLTR